MLCIEYDGLHKNRITLTRGDSATLKLKLYDAQNKPVVLTEADRAGLPCCSWRQRKNSLILLRPIQPALPAANTVTMCK